jgi:succinoglycan biosynthesis transport protein ExoP
MAEMQKYDAQPLSAEVVQFDPAVPDPSQPGIGEMIGPILRRWYVIVLVFLVICGMGIPPVWMLFQDELETSGAIRVSPVTSRIIFNDKDSERPMPNYESFKNTEANRLGNDIVLNKVADRLKGLNLEYFEGSADPLVVLRQAIKKNEIVIDPERKTELITLRLTSRIPADAEKIVNAFLDSYIEIYNTEETKGGGQTMTILEDQKLNLQKKMDGERDAVAKLIEEFGTQELTPRQTSMFDQVSSLQRELISANIKRISLETRLQAQKTSSVDPNIPIESQEKRNTIINTDFTLQQLLSEQRRYETMVAEADQTMAPANPELQRRKAMLQSMTKRVEDRRKEVSDQFDTTYKNQTERNSKRQLAEIQAELKQTIAYEKGIQDKMNGLDTTTINLGRKQFAIDNQKEQLNRTKEMYNEVCKRIEEIKVESQRPARIAIAFRASSVPVTGRKFKMIGAVGFGGMVAGMFLAFLLAKADKRLHNPNQIVRRIGVRIIGTTTSPKDVDRKVLGQHLADDYQNIRANLGLLNGDGKSRILAITSAGTGDGKTTFSVNLAVSFAQSGEKVLLIDGDLRKPDIAETLRLPKGLRGLQDVLFGKSIERAIHVTSTGVHVLAADDRNTADAINLLNQPKTAEMIRRIAAEYDHVIIDTPPVLAFADALVWARIADATILTSLVDHTSQTDLRESMERLEQIGAHVIGTVVNNVRAGHSYHRYGYGYGYGYGDQANRRPKRRKRERLLLEMPATGKPD